VTSSETARLFCGGEGDRPPQRRRDSPAAIGVRRWFGLAGRAGSRSSTPGSESRDRIECRDRTRLARQSTAVGHECGGMPHSGPRSAGPASDNRRRDHGVGFSPSHHHRTAARCRPRASGRFATRSAGERPRHGSLGTTSIIAWETHPMSSARRRIGDEQDAKKKKKPRLKSVRRPAPRGKQMPRRCRPAASRRRDECEAQCHALTISRAAG